MITVDDRTGSQDLYPLLQARGLPVQLGRMAFGDVSFIGTGADGVPVTVGVEYKQIRDVLKCITDGRFAGHQLPGLINSYDQIWLLVEGKWRSRASDGILEIEGRYGWSEASVGTRRFMCRDLYTWLFTMQVKGGIQFAGVSTSHQAVIWLSSLYQWWVNGYDSHHSHLALNSSGAPQFRDRAVYSSPPLVRRVAAELPGVGWTKSGAVADKFSTVVDLVCASERELAQVPGIGPQLARKIRNSMDTR